MTMAMFARLDEMTGGEDRDTSGELGWTVLDPEGAIMTPVMWRDSTTARQKFMADMNDGGSAKFVWADFYAAGFKAVRMTVRAHREHY